MTLGPSPVMAAAARADAALAPTVSVVIPTLNEAERIEGLLAFVGQLGFHDIVVVDGGSSDGTRDIVGRIAGVRLVPSPPGRGQQLAAGLDACGGSAILFLHADTTPPRSAVAAIRRALADPVVAGGSFSLDFDAPGRLLGFFAWWSRFDTPLTTFGDQAMFARRSALAACGGVPLQPILEDVELRWRLKTVGRFVKLPLRVVTSARRFLRTGPLVQQLRNAVIVAAYRLGVSARTLAHYYQPQRAKPARPAVRP